MLSAARTTLVRQVYDTGKLERRGLAACGRGSAGCEEYGATVVGWARQGVPAADGGLDSP